MYELKIPFFKAANENSINYDVPGFGYYFGGMIILSLILLYQLRKFYAKNEKFILYFILVSIVISIWVFPYSFWSRYSPHFYFVPIIILAFAFMKNMTMRFVPIFLLYLCLVSALHSFIPTLHSTAKKDFMKIYSQLLKNQNRIYLIYLDKFDNSVPIRMQDLGIKYKIVNQKYFEEHKSDFHTLPKTIGKSYIDFDIKK